jgi:hypothetical protein
MNAPPATLNNDFRPAEPISAGNPQWQPSAPLSSIAPREITSAHKWRQAMLTTIPRLSGRCPKSELARMAMPECLAIFRRKITERAFINQLDLVIRRDNGRNEWQRLELYLPPKIHARTTAPISAPSPETQFPALAAHLASCADPSNLTKPESDALWLYALVEVRSVPETDSKRRKRVKGSLVDYLYNHVSGIAPSAMALEKKFRRRYAEWLAQGEKTLASNFKGRPRGPDLSQEAHDAVAAYAVFNCEGCLSQAWRDYITGKIPNTKPDAALVDYYGAPENKSYVPAKIRNAIRNEVASMENIHHGPYKHGQSAHLILDDSQIFAGDWWSSDDCTLPVYFYIPSEDGCTLLRGQLLLTVDHRSRRILWFNLLPKKSYDSIDIRTHFCQTADLHGLPRKGVIWERGLWQKSKLVKGSATNDFVSPEEAELGLRGLGVRFIHRHSPKAKIIERILGALQNRMAGEPGWCGRNEQTERFEEFHKLKPSIESGRVTPDGKIYSFEQWQTRLKEICVSYNAEAHSKDAKIGALSPDQAYGEMQNQNDPPTWFDATTRYLLSTHRRAEMMKPNGITFAIGNRKFLYRGGRSGEFIGQKMLVWFSPENPDIAYVTDLDRKNPFAVELVKPIPSVDAPKEELAEQMRKLREHQAPIRERYYALKADWRPKFRTIWASQPIAETGRAFAAEREKIETNRDEIKSVKRFAADAGIQLPDTIGNPRQVREGIELRAQWEKEQAGSRAGYGTGAAPALENSETPALGKKVYILNAPSQPKHTPQLYFTLWAKIEKTSPGLNRHALTQKHLGCHPKPNEMTPDQLAKMIDVFNAILRESSAAAV